jgi:copper chaperone CopZ
MASETTVEFAVNMTCSKCVAAAESVLSGVDGVTKFSVDLGKQSVVVTSTLPTERVQVSIL